VLERTKAEMKTTAALKRTKAEMVLEEVLKMELDWTMA
jgi:hypothetical protein